MSSAAFDSLLLMVAGGLLGVITLLVLVRHPKAALAAYVAALGWAPIWFGSNAGPLYVPLHTVLAVTAILALLQHRDQRPFQPTVVDVALLATCLVIVAEFPLGLARIDLPAQLLVEWVPALVVGRIAYTRIAPDFLYRVFLVVFGVAGALAILESLTVLNLWVNFTGIPNRAYSYWGALQYRAGVLRAEGAMGHSIALGCSLAMAVPMVMAARTSVWLRIVAMLALMGGAAATLSRLGIILALVGCAAMLFLSREAIGRRLRIGLTGLLVAASLLVLWLQSTVFAAAGNEAADSAAYRVWLVSLLPGLRPFGQAASYQRNSEGSSSFGGFASIDSQLLDLALKVGWIPVLILAVLLLLALVRVLARRADPAMTSIAVQIPAVLTVAFITQYGMIMWFFAGLAVGAYSRTRVVRPPTHASTTPPRARRALPDPTDADGQVVTADLQPSPSIASASRQESEQS